MNHKKKKNKKQAGSTLHIKYAFKPTNLTKFCILFFFLDLLVGVVIWLYWYIHQDLQLQPFVKKLA